MAKCKTDECLSKLLIRGDSAFYSSATADAKRITAQQVQKEVKAGSEYWVPFYAHPKTTGEWVDPTSEWVTEQDGFVKAPLWNAEHFNAEPLEVLYQPTITLKF